MTHQLDLTPDLEAKLQQLAAQRGVDADTTALQVLAEGLLAASPAPTATAPRALRGYGKYAGKGGTVDELLQLRREEAQRELDREATAARAEASEASA